MDKPEMDRHYLGCRAVGILMALHNVGDLDFSPGVKTMVRKLMDEWDGKPVPGEGNQEQAEQGLAEAKDDHDYRMWQGRQDDQQ